MNTLKAMRFTPSDVLAAILDPAASAKAWAALILAFVAQNGFVVPGDLGAAFTDLFVAIVVGVVTWIFPNRDKADREIERLDRGYGRPLFTLIAIAALLGSVIGVSSVATSEDGKAEAALSDCQTLLWSITNQGRAFCNAGTGEVRVVIDCYNANGVRNIRYGPWVGKSAISDRRCLSGFTIFGAWRETR
jgi:hypothetical protein